jgi:TatA/E family protein of Tat protein translocase
MGSLGLPEIIFIFLIALLIFGPKKLPELGRTLGKGMAEFRRATDELKRSINTELALDETPAPAPAVLRTRRLEDPEDTRHHEPVFVPPPGEAPEMTTARPVAAFPSTDAASAAAAPEPVAVTVPDPDLPEPR